MTDQLTPLVPEQNDEELVRESLNGGREAFARIVRRYQSLVCALTYCGTGNRSRSEDLAQETFITAWKRLAELREPSHLRGWLCGIARNLTRNAQRSIGRDPVHAAEPFEEHEEAAPPQASPAQQVISREEEAILWRSLEQLATTYREPLVLFYREHRSIAEVAAALELSEDAAKQRLSRGRALLHARVLALVETTLERSKPGPAFTLGVMAVLPLLPAVTASSWVAGATATKTGATAKAQGWLAPVGALLTAQVLWFVSSVGLAAFMGGLAGWSMSDFRRQTRSERRWLLRFWWALTIGFAVFLAPMPWLLRWADGNIFRLERLELGQGLFQLLLGVPLVIWAWKNHVRIRGKEPTARVERRAGAGWLGWVALISGGAGLLVFPRREHLDGALPALLSGLVAWWGWRNKPGLHESSGSPPAEPVLHRTFLSAVALSTCVMCGLLIAGMANSHWATLITPAEAQGIIVAHPEAQYQVTLGRLSAKTLSIVVPGKSTDRPTRYYGRLDETTLALMRRTGVQFEKRVAADLGPEPKPLRRLLGVCLLGASAGVTLLVRTWHQRRAGLIQIT